MPTSPAATLASRFACIVAGLHAVLVPHMAPQNRSLPFLILLWSRLAYLNRRIATLTQRRAAGLPVAPRPHPPARPACTPPGQRPTRQRPTRQRPTRLRLPTQPGWLLAVSIQAAPYAEALRHLLDHPDMAALLQAAPHLKRQLRPILRLLLPALPPAFALPPSPSRQKPPRPAAPRASRRQKPRHLANLGAPRPFEFWCPKLKRQPEPPAPNRPTRWPA